MAYSQCGLGECTWGSNWKIDCVQMVSAVTSVCKQSVEYCSDRWITAAVRVLRR